MLHPLEEKSKCCSVRLHSLSAGCSPWDAETLLQHTSENVWCPFSTFEFVPSVDRGQRHEQCLSSQTGAAGSDGRGQHRLLRKTQMACCAVVSLPNRDTNSRLVGLMSQPTGRHVFTGLTLMDVLFRLHVEMSGRAAAAY